MSLINQVLKDLDKRGATGAIGEATIRVVHARNSRSAFLLVAAGVAGTLLVLVASWMVWNSTIKHAAPAISVAVPVRQADVLPVSQVAVASARVIPPGIDSVSPATITTAGSPQTITINGSNFKQGAKIKLREEGGHVYDDRPLLALEPTKITLKVNFGRQEKAWGLEVLNPDQSTSGQFVFTVHAAATPAAEEKNSHNSTSKQAIGESKQVKDAKMPPAERQAAEQAEGISKQPTRLTSKQQAENEFHRANLSVTQGRNAEALAGYASALQLDAGYEMARQSMVSLLLEQNRKADAERVLQAGLDINRQQTGFALLLARLQAERNALPQALDSMMQSLPYAAKDAQYQAILAALLQRQNRYKEAIDYYKKALQLKPNAGVWFMGMGISLRAEKRNEEARDAFRQALDTHTLKADLKAFVEQQLKEF